MMIGYARISTGDQSTDMQVEALRAAGCERIVTETGSGAKDRPELRMLLSMMREGDVLVVWKLDRLGRSLQQLLVTLDDLSKRKIDFKCTTQAIDTTTSSGKLQLHVIAAFAEYERSMIVERVRAGIENAKKKGVKFGAKHKLSKGDVALARAQVASGADYRRLAVDLGVNYTTLWRALRNDKQYPSDVVVQ